jgi:Fe-S-cluster containining protein
MNAEVITVTPVMRLTENPCLKCGACCAYFRVSFYWAEADPGHGGTIPPELTEDLTPVLSCMKGTNRPQPRCAALIGEIGQAVRCAIYEGRPSPCREFGVDWTAEGLRFTPEDLARCNQARAAWGLPPLLEGPHPVPQPEPQPLRRAS